MVFSDLFFLFVFIPSFAILYIIGSLIDKKLLKGNPNQNCKVRNWVLILFSLIFYSWGEPVYVFLMILSVFVNYLVGMVIDKQDRRRKAALVVGLIANIGIICVFKYLGFFAQTLNDIGIPVSIPTIALPIGISFYTFQSISYLIDVYRRESPAQHNYFNLLLYISMFPQLIAGPIVRYSTVAAEIKKRKVSSNDVAEGMFRFLCGLGKKVIIANQIGEVADQFLKNGLGDITTTGAWVGAVAFTLQIYFDFSGYSDMAIGLGRMFGFRFLENFNYPYISKSVTEFWRRWHMSLGTWFKEYVYIPLGGNRGGKLKQYRNLAVVWFLTGFWHGANWNYVLWGIYFGVLLILEKAFLLKATEKAPAFLRHLYALLLIGFGWILFSHTDLSAGWKCFLSLFGVGTECFATPTVGYEFIRALPLLAIAAVGATPIPKKLWDSLSECDWTAVGALDEKGGEIPVEDRPLSLRGKIMGIVTAIGCLLVLTVSVAYLVDSTFSPFLYFIF